MAEKAEAKTSGGRRGSVAPSTTSKKRLRRWLVPAVLIGTLALLCATVWVTSLDAACAQCHSAQAVATDESMHANVACYACHLESAWKFPEHKAAEFLRMYPRAVGGVRLDGPGQPAARAACTKCHQDGPIGILESGGLRIQHETCAAEPARCGDCHSAVAHTGAVRWSRTPVMDECLACHDEQGGSLECDTCHDGRLQLSRLATGPWQVTHGPNWQTTHGMGNLGTCVACHEASKCIRCHDTEIPHGEGYLNTHGDEALKATAKCLDCHRTKGWCTSCHGIAMPHPKGFLPGHTKIAKGYGDPLCHSCHSAADCKNCHLAHIHPGLSQEWLDQLRGSTK